MTVRVAVWPSGRDVSLRQVLGLECRRGLMPWPWPRALGLGLKGLALASEIKYYHFSFALSYCLHSSVNELMNYEGSDNCGSIQFSV